MGYSQDNIFTLEKGDVLEIDSNGAAVTGAVTAGTVYIGGTTRT